MTIQVVFVHGVANRDSDAWGKAQTQRDELLRKFVFGMDAVIANPYWGKLGANPGPDGWLALPDFSKDGDGIEWLNVGGGSAVAGEEVRLIELARDNFGDTVDAIFAELFDDYTERGEPIPDDVIEVAKMAAAMADAEPKPDWLAGDVDNDQFIDLLIFRAKSYSPSASETNREIETLGIGTWLKDGAKRLVDRVRNAGGRLVLAKTRVGLHNRVAQFVGDIFVYLKDDSQRKPIRDVIREPIRAAVASGNPVVLIGHSMGGVILADCLGDPGFRASVGLEDGGIDAFVTVGSQPGFFQELDLLGMQPAPGAKPKLAAAKTWINVLDELDVLSFRAAALFDGVEDFAFSSGTGILDAHTSYFRRNQFYHRLRVRLEAADLSVIPRPV